MIFKTLFQGTVNRMVIHHRIFPVALKIAILNKYGGCILLYVVLILSAWLLTFL